MKNIKFLLFGILLTFLLIPNVYAKDNVEIKSITQADISENTIEKSTPTHNGLEMNFDISFKQKDDFIKYKVIIKNETNVDYNISNDTSFNKSEFITYSYETTGVLKANSETIVYVTITYTNEVDPSLMVNGIYPEQNKAVIKLLDKDGNPPNPNTGINTYIIITFLLLSLLLLTILLNKNKKSKILMILLISLFIIPSMVYAIETLKLTINVKVEIKKAYKVGYIFNEDLVYTESELEQYDTSVATCDKTFYLGEKTPENKYIECKNVMFEDKKMYTEGETVTTNNLITSVNRIADKDYHEDPPIEFCQEQSDGTYLCDDRAEIFEEIFDSWHYYKSTDNYGYISFENDDTTMNFTNIEYNDWGLREAEISVYRPGTFTMPKHNVLFYVKGIAR